ncbi:ATP-dependent DNA helicase PIF1 [Leucoagaricus sp. SymC.cos]|nr:ATP-dependent DNA helicase PIF1 [Leucoagaricus sp. SymC.cos]
MISGEGGTGKSRVIQTVTTAFEERNVGHLLIKSAYTGIAASLIDGKTTHEIGAIFVGKDRVLPSTIQRLQRFWKSYEYLVIDEVSMISKSFLAKLSRNISIGKGSTRSASFGGINVILCGDFHQFPPVAQSPRAALYWPSDEARDTPESMLGRSVYEEFVTVVQLTEQIRITDPEWLDFLRHLRVGKVRKRHVELLKELVLNKDMAAKYETNHALTLPTLVTPRHGVRIEWNNAASREACRKSKQPLLICPANDCFGNRPLTLVEKIALETALAARKSYRGLPRKLEIFKGMQVMVTRNLNTDLDVTNGARGEIVSMHNPFVGSFRKDSLFWIRLTSSFTRTNLPYRQDVRLLNYSTCLLTFLSNWSEHGRHSSQD